MKTNVSFSKKVSENEADVKNHYSKIQSFINYHCSIVTVSVSCQLDTNLKSPM